MAALPKPLRTIVHSRLFWPLGGLLLLLAFNAVFSDGFFALEIRDGHLYGNLVDILNKGAPVMLLALGMTAVIGTGGIDLSVGSLMALSGGVAALVVATGHSFWLALPAALVTVSALGATSGLLVSRVRLQPFIATLVMMVAGRGMAMLVGQAKIGSHVFNGQIRFDNSAYLFLGKGHFLGLPSTLFIVLGFVVLTFVLARKTAFGLMVEAVGENETASRLSGVNVQRIKTGVYVFSGLCAGMAGLIQAAYIGVADVNRDGEMMELDAIFSVIVGGTAMSGGRFLLMGTMIGAIMLRTLTETMYALGVAPARAPLYKAIVLVCVCMLQSGPMRRQLRALFGRAES